MPLFRPSQLRDMIYREGQCYIVLVDNGEGNLFTGRQYPKYEEAAEFTLRTMQSRQRRGLKSGYCIIEAKIVADA